MAVKAEIRTREKVPGAERKTVTHVTCDTEYAEKGEPLTAKELGLTKVNESNCQLVNGSESETVEVGWANYNEDKALLELWNWKTGKQIAAGKDVSKVIVKVTAFGL